MDRTLRGLVAGTLAGIFMDTWNLVDFYFIHITKLRFLDWAAVLISWSKPKDSFNTIFYLIMHLLWDGLLGIVFAYLVGAITSRSILIKSCFFSVMCWFIFKTIVNLFRVPFLSGVQPTPGAMSNFFAVILWGIALGVILKKQDKPVHT